MKIGKTKVGLLGLTVAVAISFSYSSTVVSQECFFTTVKSTTPDTRYNDNSDGTITDKKTGLIWKKCSEGQTELSCAGGADTFLWPAAMAQARIANLENYANANNWRLPNIKELTSLVEVACKNPSININYFPNTTTIDNRKYWSSTTTFAATLAWAVNIDVGNVFYYDKDGSNLHVRLVRNPD